jgi:hypothetical protein
MRNNCARDFLRKKRRGNKGGAQCVATDASREHNERIGFANYRIPHRVRPRAYNAADHTRARDSRDSPERTKKEARARADTVNGAQLALRCLTDWSDRFTRAEIRNPSTALRAHDGRDARVAFRRAHMHARARATRAGEYARARANARARARTLSV